MRNKGFALVQVLLMTLILITLASVIIKRVNVQVESATNLKNKAQAQAKVLSAYNELMFDFYTHDLTSLFKGKAFNFYGIPFEKNDVKVTLQDNFGLFALTHLTNEQQLQALLTIADVSNPNKKAGVLYKNINEQSKQTGRVLFQTVDHLVNLGFSREDSSKVWQLITPYPQPIVSLAQTHQDVLKLYINEDELSRVNALRAKQQAWEVYRYEFENIVENTSDETMFNFIGDVITISLEASVGESYWGQKYYVRIKRTNQSTDIFLLLTSPIRKL